ncbi:TRAP transporter small permease subunit [Geomicrobium sp. JSM 1781026]|uniref:TRAP transporter small permease subunit n=1 Tax=Geomicrobium sp. JSM 1781026 TaxID=3344580 RepID=UPI0035C24EB2
MPAWVVSFENGVHRVSKWSHYVASFILLGMMFLTFFDVVGRYFIRPVLGTYELTELGLALLIFLGLSFTQLKKDHISIDFFVGKFSFRTQQIIAIFTYSTLFVLLILVSVNIVIFANRTAAHVTNDLGLPIYLVVIIAALAVIVFALTLIVELLKSYYRVVNQAHGS